MDSSESKIATIVIRGATENYMDDIERAIDDGVNVYKGLCRDGRLVPGAGAIEMELAKQINTFGEKCEGLEQYAVQRFAQALHVVPKMLAENTGVKANVVRKIAISRNFYYNKKFVKVKLKHKLCF